jgi:hypothetical protein
MKYIVLQSGDGKLRPWITEKRNVYEDFRRLFGEEPPPAKAVLIFINSQLTRSSAECDYREIFFSAE